MPGEAHFTTSCHFTLGRPSNRAKPSTCGVVVEEFGKDGKPNCLDD